VEGVTKRRQHANWRRVEKGIHDSRRADGLIFPQQIEETEGNCGLTLVVWHDLLTGLNIDTIAHEQSMDFRPGDEVRAILATFPELDALSKIIHKPVAGFVGENSVAIQ
jgi:hypothetical protein